MIVAILGGVAAGMLAGLLGVGGGVLFVPVLILAVGLGHLEAEATSLLAIVPVAAVGAWRQRRYGNFRTGDAAALGVLGIGGGAAGVVLANTVPERALEIGFGLFMLVVAVRLLARGVRGEG